MPIARLCAQAYDVWCRQNSKLPARDLINVLRCLGYNPTETEVDDIYSKMNVTDDMYLEFPQVLSASRLCKHTAESPDELVDAFRVFDKYGTGMISDKELCRMMTSLGDSLSAQEIDAMVRSLRKALLAARRRTRADARARAGAGSSADRGCVLRVRGHLSQLAETSVDREGLVNYHDFVRKMLE